jgi:hypothetical protein
LAEELFVKEICSPTQAKRGLAEKSARGACVLPKEANNKPIQRRVLFIDIRCLDN